MASESNEHVSGAPQLTPDAMRSLGVAEVAKWAFTTCRITHANAEILVKNEITGEDLLDRVTEKKLVFAGMPLGPAGRVMSAVAAVKTVEVAMPSSMGESIWSK